MAVGRSEIYPGRCPYAVVTDVELLGSVALVSTDTRAYPHDADVGLPQIGGGFLRLPGK